MLTTSNFIDKCLKSAGCLLAVGCLTACFSSEQLSDDIKNYQQRMANVLNHDAPDFTADYLPALPSSTHIDEPTETLMKLSDFYQLQHCQLASLVAQRNTVLGKIQLPSTRLLYEKQLLLGLQQCIEQTESATLKTKLQTWLTIKQQNLPRVWADMMQKSSEIHRAFSTNQGMISGQTRDGLTETLAALHFLIKSEQQVTIDSAVLEQHLADIAQFALPAKLWRSQNLLTVNMRASTLWLKQHNAMDLCDATSPLPSQRQVEYLVNVFRIFFVEKIQPVATQINHYHYKLSPLIDILIQHPALSEAFKTYLATQHQQNFADYQAAMQQHIELWQQVFKACQISPGKLNRVN